MLIESLQNDKIKRLTRLINKNSDRKKSKTFLVEGVQENERAQQYQYKVIEFYICPEIFTQNHPVGNVVLVSKKVYESIAYRGSSEGIIGLYEEKENQLEDFKPKENSGVILLESVEKPGNLGAVLRSCEAFGIDTIIVTDPKTDFYNPNVIRSSVGCLFGMNFFQTDNETAVEFFQKNNYQIITTFMDEDKKHLQNADLKQNTVVCFGTEHSGLSDFWLDKGSNYLIPMVGTIDSLNLSNAVAITCYEILRRKL